MLWFVGLNNLTHISNDWFKEYTYQLIIPKKYLNDNEIRLWSGEIYKSFPLWDPMGSLACFN